MARLTYLYEDGTTISKHISPDADKDFDIEPLGKGKPISLEIKGKVSPEFFHNFALKELNPEGSRVIYRGKEYHV